MKKLSLSLLALGLVTSGFAALPATTDPTLVAVPQLPGGFVVGVSSYYLQPESNNGLQDFASRNTGFVSPFFSQLKTLKADYELGWGANIGYIFPNTGNDVELSYFHFGTDTRSAESVINGDNLTSVLFPTSLSIVSLEGFPVRPLSSSTILRAKQDLDLDQVDLTAGQFIDVGCRLTLHPKVGLRFASIRNDLRENSFSNVNTALIMGTQLPRQILVFPFTIPFSTNLQDKSNFDGVGPMIGLDASYYLFYGFGIVGHFNTSLLAGNIESKLNTLTSFPTVITPFVPSFPVITQGGTFANSFKSDSNRIVPNWDAKIGADYTFLFGNSWNSDLTLEVGWQFSHYYNAIDILQSSETFTAFPILIIAPRAPTGRVGPITHRTTDLSFHGPYASLTLHI